MPLHKLQVSYDLGWNSIVNTKGGEVKSQSKLHLDTNIESTSGKRYVNTKRQIFSDLIRIHINMIKI